MTSPARAQVIEAVLARLVEEVAAMREAAHAAHVAATHEESRAEDAHDTRGLEASYLAGAQARRVQELERQIHRLRQLAAESGAGGAGGGVAVGSFVELAHAGRRSFYLLVPEGGGISVEASGRAVHVITPRAPLGEALLGRRPGDRLEVEIQGAPREYELVGIHA